ncbi:MAG: CPBP family intramembrane glutamic endopeptidase [Armatimonadota bacterium]
MPVPLPFTLYLLAGMLLLALPAMWVARLPAAQAGWRAGGWPALVLGLGWGSLLGTGLVAWLWLLLRTGNYLAIPTVVMPVDWAILALAAPVAEEVFFRGVLFGGLQRSWSPFWAIFLSAVADTAVHSTQPWIAVHFAAAVGYALSFRQSGSILTPILAHALAVTALLLARRHPGAVQDLPVHVLYIAGGAALALILAGSLGRRSSLV